MNVLEQILEANRHFIANPSSPFSLASPKPSRLPLRQLALFTCMDTRLVEFLEPAVGIKREEAIVIKNAGNSVTGPFEATIRSLVLAIFELGVKEILVIGHEDCGAAHTEAHVLRQKMLARGISADAIKMIQEELAAWLDSFHHPVTNIAQVVGRIRANPLIPGDIPVHGLLFDPHHGEIRVIIDGYKALPE
jgi:carbonic anhydrase